MMTMTSMIAKFRRRRHQRAIQRFAHVAAVAARRRESTHAAIRRRVPAINRFLGDDRDRMATVDEQASGDR